jgi:PPM family protein phosphatase
MYWEQNIEYAAVSDIGFRRRNNQDSYCVHIADNRDYWNQRGHLFLVADGMGGHAVGELASKIAADTIPHTFEKLRDRPLEDALREAVITGNHAIYERGELNRDFARMGTTCTTLVLHPRGASVAHVGDSRAYRIRGDRIEQLTFDHSLQWELLRQGRMSPEEIFLREPRNVITRSLGPNAEVLVDVEGPYPVLPHDALSTLVKDEEMGVIVRELPPAEACQFLVDLANLRGGTDNITVVVVRVGRAPAGAEFSEEPAPIEPDRVDRFGWLWLVASFFIGVGFIGAGALWVMSRPLEGVAVGAIALACLAALLYFRIRLRRIERLAERPVKVVPGKPYRTASAKITAKFVSEIADIEHHLQRTATEEGWSLDWAVHKQTYQAAKAHLANRRYSEALRAFARSIQTLMSGVQLLRKQRDLAVRWGVRPAPSKSEPTSN